MKGLAFSKKLAMMFVLLTTIVTLITLYICYKCVVLNYQGSLPFLSSLIALQQISVGYVCGAYMNKSKAENTAGGIVYENSIIDSKMINEFNNTVNSNDTYRQETTEQNMNEPIDCL